MILKTVIPESQCFAFHSDNRRALGNARDWRKDRNEISATIKLAPA